MSRKAGRCPRCIGGSLFIDSDGPGNWYGECLLCGHREYLNPRDSRIPRDPKVKRACELVGAPLRSCLEAKFPGQFGRILLPVLLIDLNIPGGG